MTLSNINQKSIMVGLTLFAFLLRAYRLDYQSYWIDEAWTVYFGNLSPAELWHLLQSVEVTPPFYHPSTIYWIKVFGDSEYALRFYSLIFGVMAVPFTYRLGKDLGDDRLGLIAALLVMIAPYQVWHSQEARMYSILTASSIMSMWGFVNLWQRGGWRWWLVYVIGTEWSVMVHYHAAVLIGIQGLFLLLSWRRHWRGYLRWGLTLIFIFLLSVPWLIFGSSLLQSYINWVIQPALWEAYARSAVAFSLNELVPRSQATPLTLIFVTTYGLGLLYTATRRWGPWRGRETAGLLLAYTIAPIAAAWIYGEIKTPAYLERYLIVVQIGFLLTVAAGVLAVADGLPRLIYWLRTARATPWSPPSVIAPIIHRFRQSPPQSSDRSTTNSISPPVSRTSVYLAGLLLVVLVAINSWVLYHHYFDPAYAKPDWRHLAKTIESFEQSGDAILLTGDGGDHAFNFYYKGDLPLYASFNLLPPTHPDHKKYRPGISIPDQVLATIATDHDRIWYTPYGVDIDPTVEYWLAKNSYPAWHSWLGKKRLALYSTQNTANRQEILDVTFADSSGQGPTLTKIELPDLPIAAGDLLPLKLTWHTNGQLDDDYQVSLRLINQRSDTFAQSDWPPLAAEGTSSTWAPNQAIIDHRSLWIPPDTPPGPYLLQMVVYDPSSGQPVGQPLTVDKISVAPAKKVVPPDALAIPNPTRQPLRDIALIGSAWPAEIQPGQEMWLWLYWQRLAGGGISDTTELRLSLSSGAEIFTTDYTLAAELGSLDSWQAGQVRRAVYHVPTSPRLTGATAEIRVSLVSTEGAEVKINIGSINLITRPRRFETPDIDRPLDITFGNNTLLKLIGYELPSNTLVADDGLPLTLYWQANSEISVNYTVFIQLLNHSDQVVAQVDVQPQAGEAPTSTWLPGEIVIDTYRLPLPDDLPAGEYRLIAGLYDANSGQRLPIASGHDFVNLEQIMIK